MTLPPSADRVEAAFLERYGRHALNYLDEGVITAREMDVRICAFREGYLAGERVSASKAASAAVEECASIIFDTDHISYEGAQHIVNFRRQIREEAPAIVAAAVEKAKGGGPDAG